MLLVEVVVAKGDIGRMNTVFKLGLQSWVLFAVSSAVALTWVWGLTARRLTDHRRPTTNEAIRDTQYATRVTQPAAANFSILAWVWRGAAALLIAAALVYPLTATPARIADRYDSSVGWTLDGAAYMRSPK